MVAKKTRTIHHRCLSHNQILCFSINPWPRLLEVLWSIYIIYIPKGFENI